MIGSRVFGKETREVQSSREDECSQHSECEAQKKSLAKDY